MYRLFKFLGRLRRGRAMHPRGELYKARVRLQTNDLEPNFILGQEYTSWIRVSRSAGLPGIFPDIQGMAIKIEHADSEQDWLLAIGGQGRLTKYALYISRYIDTHCYTSCFPYQLNGKTVLLGARIRQAAAGNDKSTRATLQGLRALEGMQIDLLTATVLGRWHKVGALRIGALQPHESGRAISFNPWNTVPNLQPSTWLNKIRRSSYRGSRDGRHQVGH